MAGENNLNIKQKLKTAQIALQAQKEFLAQVIDISPNAIFVRDRAGRYILANQAAAASFGLSVEELLGNSEGDFNANAEQTTRFLEEDRQVMDSLEELFTPEELVEFPDGSQRWIQTTKRPLIDPDGAANQVLVTLVDITAQKKNETARRQQQRILNEPLNELKCLYQLSRTLETYHIPDENFFLAILEIIPPAWQFPDITGAKLVFEEREFTTDNFSATRWMQASPIIVFGEACGVLMVSYLEEKPAAAFGPFLFQEQDLLNEIAERVGRRIERYRIESTEREQRALAEAINDISAALNSTLELDEVLARIAGNMERIVENDAANIWLLDEQMSLIKIMRWTETGRVSAEEPRTRVVSEIAAYRQMIQTRRGLAIPDTHESALWSMLPEREWIRSYLGAPIFAREKLVGFINLFSAVPGFYTEAHIQKLNAFSHQAAIALENAHLFEKNRDLFQEVWEGRRRLQALSWQLLNLQEAEKKHMARELHDEVGQLLTAIKFNLQVLQNQNQNPAIDAQLQDSNDIVDRTLAQVRGLLLDLRPSLLDDLGLRAALRSHFARIMQRADFTIRFKSDPLPERLPPEIETICYRVVQEALTNITKYAETKQVFVVLHRQESGLHLCIEDDGAGFDVEAARERAAQGKSLGVISMEERVLLGGGRFTLESAPASGTRIVVWLPLPPASHTEQGG